MNRTASLVMAFVTVVSMAVAAPAAAAGMADVGIQADDEHDVQPGERLSGVVGAQEAEIDGEIESRAHGLAIANAGTNESKADVVAETLEYNGERMADLERHLEELEQRRDAGEMTEGEYHARTAKVAVQLETVERTTDQSARAADDLPAEMLDERGLGADAIDQLRRNASDLRGDAADVADDIAVDRPGAGGSGAGDAPEDVNQSIDRSAHEVDHADERIDAVERRIDDDEDAQATLEDARERLETAELALADARAVAGENAEEALDRADDALEHAEAALDLVEEADDERTAGSDAGDDGVGDD